MRLLLSVLVFILVWADQAAAEEWLCSNKNAEIKCNSKTCEVTTDSFTPTSLTVNTDGGVSFCAYLGLLGRQSSENAARRKILHRCRSRSSVVNFE